MRNQETFDDYPQAASQNAQRALDWLEENDNPNDCLTPVGFARANQLAKREALSRETVQRIANFRRFDSVKDVPYEDGCGGIAWDAWGGEEGIAWAERTIERLKREEEENNMNNKKQSFYNFRDQGQTATIDIFAEIDSWWGYSAQQIKYDLDSFQGKEIIVNINSAGGSVTEGIAIANLLKAEKRPVTTRAVGVAASIASVILLAGDTVEMSENSFVMIHNVWGEVSGEAKDLRSAADTMDEMSETIQNIYVQAIKSRKHEKDKRTIKKEIADLMEKESWLSAEKALALGMIDKIKTFESGASNKVRARLYNQIKSKFNKNLPKNMENLEPKNGASLAAMLNAAIEDKVTEEMSRADIVAMMAEAAGIETSTVNGILNGEPNCPPLERLEGFAQVLEMSMSSIQSAAEEDGCQYGDMEEDEENKAQAKKDCEECNKAKEAQEETSQNKGVLATIRNLLGLNSGKKIEEAKNKEKEANDKLSLALEELENLRKENDQLKAKLEESNKDKAEAYNLLKDSEKILSPIAKIKNRKGESFQNVSELIQEYNALIAHNKELGGIDSNTGAPVSDEELVAPIEKRQISDDSVDLKAKFAEIKQKVDKENKKDK